MQFIACASLETGWQWFSSYQVCTGTGLTGSKKSHFFRFSFPKKLLSVQRGPWHPMFSSATGTLRLAASTIRGEKEPCTF
jgi:hypothetical protein